MINNQMRNYLYYTLSNTIDEYGQRKQEEEPKGLIKMAINILSQTTEESILYQDASYIGLTTAPIDDTYIIDFDGINLKVLYVNPMGRLKQVFMAVMK